MLFTAAIQGTYRYISLKKKMLDFFKGIIATVEAVLITESACEIELQHVFIMLFFNLHFLKIAIAQ